MKQVKIAYDKCKAKMPHQPPDEIDFGLGFRAGVRWASDKVVESSSPQEALQLIQEELQQ